MRENSVQTEWKPFDVSLKKNVPVFLDEVLGILTLPE